MAPQPPHFYFDEDDYDLEESFQKLGLDRSHGSNKSPAQNSNAADQALQQFLHQYKFQFQLYPHQYAAVRKVAGVHSLFPLATPSQQQPQADTRGFCLGDAMGLGKTVEAIAGAILRNALAFQRGEADLPTLVISPNADVQNQWIGDLLQNGVTRKQITVFDKAATFRSIPRGCLFVLMTRYNAQSELKAVFDGRKRSALFPNVSDETLEQLHEEWKYSSGKGGKTCKEKDEKQEDAITFLLASELQRLENEDPHFWPTFRTVIVDEAHFLKNRLTFWTMSTALAGMHAERVVALSGTPYNNSVSDIASIMTLIDPIEQSAQTWWWEEQLNNHKLSEQTISLTRRQWKEEFLLRRGKNAIANDLPTKIVQNNVVHVLKSDLEVYEPLEACVIDQLKMFAQVKDTDKRKKNEIFRAVMALMSSMRMSLIHPLIPGKGREVTAKFSPSRKHLTKACLADQCVCCSQTLRPSVPFSGPRVKNKGLNVESNKDSNPDDMEEFKNYNDDIDEVFETKAQRNLKPIPRGVCRAVGRHFAHPECVQELVLDYKSHGKVCCPRCIDLKKRVGQCCAGPEVKRWCQNVVSDIPEGFVGSPKLDRIAEWAQNAPSDEKILFASFFKGGLDLLEGILVHDFGWKCARFDGDVTPKEKSAALARFQRDSSCRALLMTVQSGGVGLNLTQASRMVFLDRWFNPFTHEQAEDRIYRLGQIKDVEIHYFDVAGTIDEGMFEIHKTKKGNSQYILDNDKDDGKFDFEVENMGSLQYTELTGMVGKWLRAIQRHRFQFLSDPQNHGLLIPAHVLKANVQRSNGVPKTKKKSRARQSL